MSPLIGATLGQYQIVEQIGRGGMATVYRARQPALGRDVAIKVLRDTLDPAAAARFDREARAVASLSHPNILPIYDYGDDDGHRYFVTQYVPGGRTLADVVAAGPLDPARALPLMALVLDALAYAHARGIVHRDVKPANIMLPDPDWPMLADFGIAESLTATTELTLPGQIIGTANYMAPERAADRPADARSDLYSVGVVLFELLTGRLPFLGETPLAVLVQHVNEPPPAPGSFVAGLPTPVERAVLRALAKSPDERQQSAAELAAELRRLARDLDGAGPVPTVLLPAATPPPPAPAAHATPREAPAPPTAWRDPAPPTVRREDAAAQPAAAPPAPRARPAPARLPWLPLLVGLALLAALGLWAATRGPGGAEITLEDTAWEGGYRRSDGVYGGRTSTWVYAAGSGFDTMGASFTLERAPGGRAELVVEGMDSEGPLKTEIVVAVNGQTIYNGPNPLPDDDFVFETGTWASHSFPFDAALLRAGENRVTISNVSPGRFGQPPFLALDYAVVRAGSR